MKKLLLLMIVLFIAPTLNILAEEPCLDSAEKALTAGKYTDAINYANLCIENFRSQADALQRQLEKAHATIKTGKVASPQERHAIFANGLLNDVATACFYKGEAAEALMHATPSKKSKESYRQIAVEALKLAKQLNYGRHFNPSGEGSFWSPAEEADKHLAFIGK